MSTVTPARIMEVGMAFWPAKVLLSAVELGLFTQLGATSMTGRELQSALRLHLRANPDFFDALVALHFLERDGVGPEARYRNTAETALFLDRHSPNFGDFFGWCREVGFKRFEVIPLAGPGSAGVAYK